MSPRHLSACLPVCLSTQHALHEGFGGVVPSLARQAHQERIDSVVQQALAQAGLAGVE